MVDAGALGAPLLEPEQETSELVEPVEPVVVGQPEDGGGAQPAAAAGVSRAASPGLLGLDPELESDPEAEPEVEARAGGDAEPREPPDSAAAPIGRRKRAFLALALTVALISPVALPIAVFQLLNFPTSGEICPFVQVNGTAQREIEKLFRMNAMELKSAVSHGTLEEGTVLQLVHDADNRLFSETWVASAPIALRNSFLAWMAAKLFFAATELQDRGLMGMAVAGHGARTSVVGDDTASAAGWLTIVGDTSTADLLAALKLWGFALLQALIGACLCGGAESRIAGDYGVGTAAGALLFALPTFYYTLRDVDTSTQREQPTWEEARRSLGLTWRQAVGLSVAKFSLWHWSQPVAYLLVLERYFGCSEFMDESQQVVGSIVAGREVIYMASTVVAVFACPVYLLLDVRTAMGEAETRFESFYRLLAYLTMPHNFVSLCLANRSESLRLVFLPLALCQVIADFASCFALGPLLLSSTPSPAALKIGYTVTSIAFVGFFGPLTVLSLLRTARDKEEAKEGKESHGRFTRTCAMVAGVTLGLGLLYVILGFILAAAGFDVVCGWFWFMTPDCGEHSVCGAVGYGKCGPCIGDFITPSAWRHDRTPSWISRRGPPCQLDCATACGVHGTWHGDIALSQSAGACGCACSDDSYIGDRCQVSCSDACGAHATVNVTGTRAAGECRCTCSDGYIGDQCQVDCGGDVCGVHGRLDIASSRAAGACRCACSDNYGGDRCQISCSGFPTCGEHASWDDPEVGSCGCVCSSGYAGDRCQIDCNADEPCGAHGSLDIAGTRAAGQCRCNCTDGYGGDRCQVRCSGLPSCGAHGFYHA
jgi:hypothetical protein